MEADSNYFLIEVSSAPTLVATVLDLRDSIIKYSNADNVVPSSLQGSKTISSVENLMNVVIGRKHIFFQTKVAHSTQLKWRPMCARNHRCFTH